MEIQAKDYKAGIKDTNDIIIPGTTFASLQKNLKKMANINCKTTHTREVIFSEFKQGAWCVCFWNKKTCWLDAWIEWR